MRWKMIKFYIPTHLLSRLSNDMLNDIANLLQVDVKDLIVSNSKP